MLRHRLLARSELCGIQHGASGTTSYTQWRRQRQLGDKVRRHQLKRAVAQTRATRAVLRHRSGDFTAAAVHRQQRTGELNGLPGVQEGPGSAAEVFGVEVTMTHGRAWTAMTH